jgi:hypothetical protein
MEEQVVTERIRRKLEEVNATVQQHLAGVQDHVNFTMQVRVRGVVLGIRRLCFPSSEGSYCWGGRSEIAVVPWYGRIGARTLVGFWSFVF